MDGKADKRMFQPNFKYTNKIMRLLARIQAAREVIINSPLIPAWEKQLQREALIKQTHHTTSIEGNPLTLEEVELIIEGKEVLAHEKNKKEVQNYVDVLKYIDSLPENGLITEEFLLEIHRLTAKNILPDDSAGNYRKVQVVVGDPKTWKVTYTLRDLLKSLPWQKPLSSGLTAKMPLTSCPPCRQELLIRNLPESTPSLTETGEPRGLLPA
ncbi:Fic family protein [Methanosarcina acetivorans]|uniref:Fic family protein n=2 Tax=Methanosarcina acetivorans TaxID=2214 RepID=UPI000A000970|nr:hypothetical protein [Methanosarcina acetivorans]